RPFSDPISSVLSRFPLSRFPFRRFRLYQILSGPDSRSAGFAEAFGLSLVGLSTFTTLADFPVGS
ncbi:hypothetical protein AB0A81_29845, partial [Streptomyces flaveolus]